MQRCPGCNARLKEAVNCPRCKADLEQIIRVQEWAKRWHQKAVAYYLNNEIQESLDALTRSLQLQHNESAFLFRAFVKQKQEQTAGLVKLQRIVQDVIYRATILLKCLKGKLANKINTIYHSEKKSMKDIADVYHSYIKQFHIIVKKMIL